MDRTLSSKNDIFEQLNFQPRIKRLVFGYHINVIELTNEILCQKASIYIDLRADNLGVYSKQNGDYFFINRSRPKMCFGLLCQITKVKIICGEFSLIVQRMEIKMIPILC